MPKYKNIRVKKPNGGTRMQRVQVLKSGKYKFVKNTGTSRKRARTAKRAAPRRRRTYVARRKKRGTRRRQKIPIAATVGMLIGLKRTWDARKDLNAVCRYWTGYDPGSGRWDYKTMDAMIPVAAGAVASMAASKIGLNRYVKVPFVKI